MKELVGEPANSFFHRLDKVELRAYPKKVGGLSEADLSRFGDRSCRFWDRHVESVRKLVEQASACSISQPTQTCATSGFLYRLLASSGAQAFHVPSNAVQGPPHVSTQLLWRQGGQDQPHWLNNRVCFHWGEHH